MKTLLSLFLLGLLFLVGCQKEIDFNDPQNGGNNGNNGNGGNGGNGGNASGSYFPLTKDSWWKYKDSLTGVTSVGTATARTKSISSIVYTAMVSSANGQTDTSWAASPSPNYYMYSKGISPNGGAYEVLFHYLNDTAAVGYNWDYVAGQGNGFTANIKTTVVAKGLTMTVAGKTYTNVIQTRLDLTYDLFGTAVDFGNYNYFTAKGIGVIKVRSELGTMGIPILQTCSDLIDYSIK